MSLTTSVQHGTLEHLNAIATLHTDSWRTNYAGIMPADFLNGPLQESRRSLWHERLTAPVPGSALFVAPDDKDEVRGFVYLLPRPDGRILLDNLHVRPGQTGQGLGGHLLRHSLTWAAREHPGQQVYLEVLTANTRAIAFYERHGATRTDTRTCHFEEGFELTEHEYAWQQPPSSSREHTPEGEL